MPKVTSQSAEPSYRANPLARPSRRSRASASPFGAQIGGSNRTPPILARSLQYGNAPTTTGLARSTPVPGGLSLGLSRPPPSRHAAPNMAPSLSSSSRNAVTDSMMPSTPRRDWFSYPLYPNLLWGQPPKSFEENVSKEHVAFEENLSFEETVRIHGVDFERDFAHWFYVEDEDELSVDVPNGVNNRVRGGVDFERDYAQRFYVDDERSLDVPIGLNTRMPYNALGATMPPPSPGAVEDEADTDSDDGVPQTFRNYPDPKPLLRLWEI